MEDASEWTSTHLSSSLKRKIMQIVVLLGFFETRRGGSLARIEDVSSSKFGVICMSGCTRLAMSCAINLGLRIIYVENDYDRLLKKN